MKLSVAAREKAWVQQSIIPCLPCVTQLMTDGCVQLLYNSSWKLQQLAAGQPLSRQPVRYDKSRLYGPSITSKITPTGSLSSSQPGGPPGWALQPSASLVWTIRKLRETCEPKSIIIEQKKVASLLHYEKNACEGKSLFLCIVREFLPGKCTFFSTGNKHMHQETKMLFQHKFRKCCLAKYKKSDEVGNQVLFFHQKVRVYILWCENWLEYCI